MLVGFVFFIVVVLFCFPLLLSFTNHQMSLQLTNKALDELFLLGPHSTVTRSSNQRYSSMEREQSRELVRAMLGLDFNLTNAKTRQSFHEGTDIIWALVSVKVPTLPLFQ